MNPALREAMLAADGAGELQGDDIVRGRAEHPACGDVVELTLRIDDAGVVRDLAWRADGCPTTLAVAAIARALVRDCRPDEFRVRLRDRLAALGIPRQHHAESLLLRALADAASA